MTRMTIVSNVQGATDTKSVKSDFNRVKKMPALVIKSIGERY